MRDWVSVWWKKLRRGTARLLPGGKKKVGRAKETGDPRQLSDKRGKGSLKTRGLAAARGRRRNLIFFVDQDETSTRK